MTVKQIEYQLERAERAYNKALKGFDAAAIERAADACCKQRVNLRIAKGVDEYDALDMER